MKGDYLTASEILITDASKNIVSAPVATYPSLTELSYVKGVTSAIQTQLNTKQATITFGTGVQTALGVNIGSAGAPVLFDGALGTPSSGTVTNLTGTASININGTVGATTPTTATFTTATVNTGLVPDVNDGAYLGTSSAAFSDLFLAEGGVINWDNGDATLTQTGNVLALAGADFQIATAGVGTNADSVPTLSSSSALSNKTIAYSTEPATDDTAYGETMGGILAGDTLAQWDLVYLDSTSGRWEKADADAIGTAGSVLLGLAMASGTDGGSLTVLLKGIVRNDGWTWSGAGKVLYASTTAAAMSETAVSGEDDVARVLGHTLSDDCIFFNPSVNWIIYKA